jgi:hypothetical protein
MAHYKIVKEIDRGGLYYKLLINSRYTKNYLVDDNYTGKNPFIGKEEYAIPALKRLIEIHKQYGDINAPETVYEETY